MHGIFTQVFSFLFTLGHQFVRGFSRVVFSDYLNQLVSSDIRATMISVQSMIARLVYAMFLPSLGLVTDHYGIQMSFYYVACCGCVAGGVVIFFMFYRGVIDTNATQ